MTSAAALLVLLQLASPGGAGQVSGISPPEGTTGTIVTITGSGFGTKPRVRLVHPASGKMRRLKVLAFDDGSITARVRKPFVGTFDVVVKLAGQAPAVLADGFAVMPPTDVQLDESCTEPGDVTSLTGRFLGSRKGTVRVGHRKAKVLSWEMGTGGAADRVVFRVPKKKVFGTTDVELRNKVGTTLSEGVLSVFATEAGIPTLGEESLDGQFDASPFVGLAGTLDAVFDAASGETTVDAVDAQGRSVGLRILYDPRTMGARTLDGLDVLGFTYQSDGVLWVVGFDELLASSLTIDITANCNGILAGSFGGTLEKRFSPDTIAVTDGTFQVAWELVPGS